MELGEQLRGIPESLSSLVDDLDVFDQTAEAWDIDLRMDLTSIIVRHLKRHGLSQRKLAQIAGMKPSQLSRILHGSQNWTSALATRILHAIGVKAKLVEVKEEHHGKETRTGKGATRLWTEEFIGESVPSEEAAYQARLATTPN